MSVACTACAFCRLERYVKTRVCVPADCDLKGDSSSILWNGELTEDCQTSAASFVVAPAGVRASE